MSAIKALIWDFAGVILHTVKGSFNSRLAERLGAPLADVEAVLDSPINVRWDIDEIDDITFYTHLLNALQLPLEKIPVLQHFVVKDFYVDDVVLTNIKTLRSNYTNVLLTNFPKHFHDFIKTDWIIDGAFDHIIASCDVKLVKPDPAIYQLALERAGYEPQESVFIDDRPVNVQAAQELGMHGIVFENKTQAFDQLEKILAN